MMTKTTISAKKETVERDWYVIDATNKVLGRLSTEIADMLRGKKKPCYAGEIVKIVVIAAPQIPMPIMKHMRIASGLSFLRYLNVSIEATAYIAPAPTGNK